MRAPGRQDYLEGIEMLQPQSCRACGPSLSIGPVEMLAAVRADLTHSEMLNREIEDLTTLLQARLSAGQFRLVWSLRDAVERLALVDEMLRERELVEVLARHLPSSTPAIRE